MALSLEQSLYALARPCEATNPQALAEADAYDDHTTDDYLTWVNLGERVQDPIAVAAELRGQLVRERRMQQAIGQWAVGDLEVHVWETSSKSGSLFQLLAKAKPGTSPGQVWQGFYGVAQQLATAAGSHPKNLSIGIPLDPEALAMTANHRFTDGVELVAPVPAS